LQHRSLPARSSDRPGATADEPNALLFSPSPVSTSIKLLSRIGFSVIVSAAAVTVMQPAAATSSSPR
jgi:hypothetical protein